MGIFFTADLHLNHKNIIKYCNRPFSSVEEMNDTIINNWNSRITDRDTVYILGDLIPFEISSSRIRNLICKLNGTKVLIPGNHDVVDSLLVLDDLILVTNLIYDTILHNRKFTLCHYKMATWNNSHRGSIHLFGHSHGTVSSKGLDSNNNIIDTRSMDVGVDTNNFYPYSINDIVVKLDNIPLPKLCSNRDKDEY